MFTFQYLWTQLIRARCDECIVNPYKTARHYIGATNLNATAGLPIYWRTAPCLPKHPVFDNQSELALHKADDLSQTSGLFCSSRKRDVVNTNILSFDKFFNIISSLNNMADEDEADIGELYADSDLECEFMGFHTAETDEAEKAFERFRR